MNNKPYVQTSTLDILEKQNKQTEQKPHNVCNYCKKLYLFCYECKYLEEGGETNDNSNTGRV